LGYYSLIVFLGKNQRLLPDRILPDTYPRMESAHDFESGDSPPPSFEDDAELEREYQELAQWLIDVHLWKVEQERKSPGTGPVDTLPLSPTM
jgi:hypothetical protein